MIASNCGGRVVVDSGSTGAAGAAGHGGQGGSSISSAGTGSSTSSSTGSGGSPVDAGPKDAADASTCEAHATPPSVVATACFYSTYCAPAGSASAVDQITVALGLCDTSQSSCCGETLLDDVPCDPTDTEGDCCYDIVTHQNQCTDGSSSSSGGGGGPPGCFPNTEPCDVPADCCSQQCNVHFTCGPVLCRPEGTPCSSGGDCCEAQCTQLPHFPTTVCYHCIHSGEPCSDAGLPCCGTICDASGHC